MLTTSRILDMAIRSGSSPVRIEFFALLGTHGEAILVDPKSKLVMVHCPRMILAVAKGKPFGAALLEKLGREQ